MLVAHAVMAILIGTIPVLLVRRAHQHGVFGVRLDVFLQILRPFERLATKLTSMRFQWHVDTDVGGDVVPLDDLNLTVTPPAGEIEIVGALATDVGFANVILQTTSTAVPWRGVIDLLHKAARGSQPSSHSWPIGRCRSRCCCWAAGRRLVGDEHDDADADADVDDAAIDVDLKQDWLGYGLGMGLELGLGLGLGAGLGLCSGLAGLGPEAQLDWRT